MELLVERSSVCGRRCRPILAVADRAGATYPAQAVHLLVEIPAGYGADVTARLIAKWLSDRLGQQFIVDNRPGAGTNVATELIVRAPPDGFSWSLKQMQSIPRSTRR